MQDLAFMCAGDERQRLPRREELRHAGSYRPPRHLLTSTPVTRVARKALLGQVDDARRRVRRGRRLIEAEMPVGSKAQHGEVEAAGGLHREVIGTAGSF